MISLRVISSQLIQQILTMDQTIPLIEQAFVDYTLGRAIMPPKQYLDLPQFEGDFRAMPAYSATQKIAGIKWVNSHRNNAQKNLPAVMATLILNDAETGQPLALIDGSELTAFRTGAAGGVAIKTLASPNATDIALIGAGKQAYYQALAALCIHPNLTIHLYDRSTDTAQRLKTMLAPHTPSVKIHDSIQSCVQAATLVTTTTPSYIPIIQKDWLNPGTHINAIGADAPGKQELDPNILLNADIYIDDHEQAHHSGEINVPLTQGILKEEDIRGTLGDVCSGKLSITSKQSKPFTVFDSTGLAIQDIALGAYLYTESEKHALGTCISL